MSTSVTQKPSRILLEDTQAIIIDIQQAFASHIYEMDSVVTKTVILAQGLQALKVPIMLNEQYPKGLGATVETISDVLNDTNKKVFEKSYFSVCDTEESLQHIYEQKRNNIIVCGIETHICVQQTVLDLLAKGMQPVLIADAVSARDPKNTEYAIQRMQQAGAVITTVESILFELCRSSRHPMFKTISNLVK